MFFHPPFERSYYRHLTCGHYCTGTPTWHVLSYPMEDLLQTARLMFIVRHADLSCAFTSLKRSYYKQPDLALYYTGTVICHVLSTPPPPIPWRILQQTVRLMFIMRHTNLSFGFIPHHRWLDKCSSCHLVLSPMIDGQMKAHHNTDTLPCHVL